MVYVHYLLYFDTQIPAHLQMWCQYVLGTFSSVFGSQNVSCKMHLQTASEPHLFPVSFCEMQDFISARIFSSLFFTREIHWKCGSAWQCYIAYLPTNWPYFGNCIHPGCSLSCCLQCSQSRFNVACGKTSFSCLQKCNTMSLCIAINSSQSMFTLIITWCR